MTSPFFDDTLAVMVLYQKGVDESETLLSLSQSLRGRPEKIDILVYDNSPAPQWRDDGKPWDGLSVRYINDPSNPGVSRAYNAGFELARKLHKKWLLLLDQDTRFPDRALDRYAMAAERHGEDLPLLAPMLVCDGRVYSPCLQVLQVNLPLRAAQPRKLSTRWRSVLGSGMCIRLDVYDKIGGFDERIPLDFADHDFFRRYRRHFQTFLLIDVVCQHGFSGRETSDIDTSLTRFGYYCEGARNSIRNFADLLLLPALALVRATRLSLRFGSVRFLRLLFRILCLNSPSRPFPKSEHSSPGK
jgi:GT2 family glycosyltransferase